MNYSLKNCVKGSFQEWINWLLQKFDFITHFNNLLFENCWILMLAEHVKLHMIPIKIQVLDQDFFSILHSSFEGCIIELNNEIKFARICRKLDWFLL